MKSSLIAGLGNSGYQDEAVGLFMVNQIGRHYPKSCLKTVLLDNDLLKLLSYYENEENVLFISGAYFNQPAGYYTLLPLPRVKDRMKIIGIAPPVIRTLYHEIPQFRQADSYVLTIQIHWNEWGDELSPEVSATVKRLLHNFTVILEKINFLA